MKVKKYTGETMQDVVFQVKADLGPEAVIINKRKFKKGGIFGFFGREVFEVVAALENGNPKKTAAAENDELDIVEISNYKAQNKKEKRVDIQKTAAEDPKNKNAIKEFINDLKSNDLSDQTDYKKEKQKEINKKIEKNEKIEKTRSQNKKQKKNNNKFKNHFDNYNQENKLTAAERLENKFKNKKSAAPKKEYIANSNQLYNYLLDQGVDSRNLNLFLKKLNNSLREDSNKEYKIQLKDFLAKYFEANSPINLASQQKLVSFIGPTGVGKTTTMAKIAADFAINQDKKVALITADTYRIAAVEQLQTYSKIIDIPFAVCYSGEKLKEMISARFSSCDLVLIDTPGSSWKDDLQLGRLEAFVDRDLIDEVHLLLSLNTKSSDLRSIITKFAALKADKVLYTKLDETNSYGDIINISENYDLPISYLTFGQDVPEDLEMANADKIFEYLFGGLYG